MPEGGAREVWITGIGLVSSLGEGLDAHWEALTDGRAPVTDAARFAPYVVHPLVKLTYDSQIPKKGDQRQMETWQRIGTYTAGLALDSAGIAKNADILGRTDMIVGAGGGERDHQVDTAILNDLIASNDAGRLLNERLLADLRPTLSLAQLSNLLAGNISIVHGVTGSSRTFMGEESSGVDAVRVGHARIAAGQSEIGLVGGAYNAEREDMLLLYALNDFCMTGEFRPVFSGRDAPGIPSGSMGAFLVLESADHARARGATPIARLAGVWSERAKRDVAGSVAQTVAGLLAKGGDAAILSGATGARGATEAEAEALAASGRAVRSVANRIGHGFEAQFPAALALAALAVSRGALFPALPGDPVERGDGAVDRILVTGVGHWRGEGAGLVEKIG
ncbi:beta-ketoacyl-ACP synthase [Aquabacter spiritensis]|uniref:3-oxoacyl-[acyl-carrier-protein] synthase II n=1 Tax=Aquabacter spiritensis TaxID=933073 RepID=A0A4R3LRM7_9HYPH|nr:beta-ketoacyl-ACP synthase [Aquabacter spiritensis]TCT02961.1 3-oxoacyl-[acyl-carrier-protein] synthase II [Aquabacter spiritensis]